MQLTEDQKNYVDRIEAMNRKERRAYARQMKKDMALSFTPKIPGSQKPMNH